MEKSRGDVDCRRLSLSRRDQRSGHREYNLSDLPVRARLKISSSRRAESGLYACFLHHALQIIDKGQRDSARPRLERKSVAHDTRGTQELRDILGNQQTVGRARDLRRAGNDFSGIANRIDLHDIVDVISLNLPGDAGKGNEVIGGSDHMIGVDRIRQCESERAASRLPCGPSALPNASAVGAAITATSLCTSPSCTACRRPPCERSTPRPRVFFPGYSNPQVGHSCCLQCDGWCHFPSVRLRSLAKETTRWETTSGL